MITGCWAKDPHKRPSFKEILIELDAIAKSGFTQTPNESFHTMQDGWKKEIAEVLHELRLKEKVGSRQLTHTQNNTNRSRASRTLKVVRSRSNVYIYIV